MPNIPKNILDLLGDIDASNPANDSVQLDDLIQHVQKSAPTPKFTKIAKQIKITPHQGTKEILKEKISFEQLDAVPEFEIEKNVGEFSHFSIREKPDFLSKITVPEKKLGPFFDLDDKPIFYDLFRLYDDYKLFFTGETDAAIIFPVKLSRLVIDRRSSTLNLPAGNVWIRADLLDSAAPKKNYVGFKIKKGEIAISTSIKHVDKSVTIPRLTAFSCIFHLDNSYKPGENNYSCGIDGIETKFLPPEKITLSYRNATFEITESSPFSATCLSNTFTLNQNTNKFKWNSKNSAVQLKLKGEQATFNVKTCKSKFYEISGECAIKDFFWMLPTKVIQQNQNSEVRINGLLNLNLAEGLAATWDGIKHLDYHVKLNATQLFLFNGEFTIKSSVADFSFINENYQLWQKSKELPQRMEMNLSYSKYQEFALTVSLNTEIISGLCDTDFKIDRPILAENIPVHPKFEKSNFAKGIAQDKKIVVVLQQLKDLEESTVLIRKKTYQFALENAYFNTSKELQFMVRANWIENNISPSGEIDFVYNIYQLLPTLPHPYASNIIPKVNRKDNFAFQNHISIGFLYALISWETEENFTEAEVNFKMKLEKLATDETVALSASRVKHWSASVKLLDVSTESDHWGIALNYSNLDYLKKISHDQINYTEENVITINKTYLQAPAALLDGFTLPHVSWEPVVNMSPPNPPTAPDPQAGILYQENNSIPTVFSTLSPDLVKIHPITFIKHFKAKLRPEDEPQSVTNFEAQIKFSLPNGKYSTVTLSPYVSGEMMNKDHLQFINPSFKYGSSEYFGSTQFRISAKKGSADQPPKMKGNTTQTYNLVNSDYSILGQSVTNIFNNVFSNGGMQEKGVPLNYIDFSGYGASTFSNWKDSTAKFASIAQAKFDIFRGRTANEIIQAVSVIYPWGISTTRTVTFLRNNNAIIFREDSGWVAQSDGHFDFSFMQDNVRKKSPYEIYQGLTQELQDVRNITEDYNDVIKINYTTTSEDYYFDKTQNKVVTGVSGKNIEAKFVAVYFDSDVRLENIEKAVTGKSFKGYLQLQPEGIPVPARVLDELIRRSNNSIGGNIDTTFNIEKTLQKFKANRVEVSASFKNGNNSEIIFVSSVKGSVVLPSEGSWSVVEVDKNAGSVSNLAVGTSVGLIKDGERPKNFAGMFKNNTLTTMLALPDSLKNPEQIFGKAYGILQNTDTQKLLLNAPKFVKDKADEMLSDPALLADCFRLMNSKGPFPNIFDAITVENAVQGATKLLPDGLQKIVNFEVPDHFAFNVIGDDNSAFRVYLDYSSQDKDGNNKKKSVINYVTDPTSIEKWANKMHNITLGVDLLCFKPIMFVTGNFGNGKTFSPTIEMGNGPQLQLHPILQKIYEILEFLANLDPTNPSEAIKKGLKIAMSNSADSWEYKFKADKEIPVVKFPFDPITYNAPTTPLKMDAFFKVGVYFNQPIRIPKTIDQIKPSVGAYLELGASLRVMCVSLAAATIYAQGRAEVGLSADLNNPPTLYFKFGFGVELCVGLPVIGSVALTYMVGIDMKINSEELVIGAFIYFRGRVELIAGIVTISISIEAAGKIQKIGNGPTNCIAMCTFALDISVAFVINLNFTETWQETRQIS